MAWKNRCPEFAGKKGFGVNEMDMAICYGRTLSDNLIFRIAAMQVWKLRFRQADCRLSLRYCLV